MAILSKIRDRSAFLIIIVGLALFAFVLDPSSIQQFFSATGINDIGAVNGDKINREEFSKQVENQRARTGGRTSQLKASEAVWNREVDQLLYQQEMRQAGIRASEQDIWDAIIDNSSINSSPLFADDEGNFDEQKLKEYIAELKVNSNSNPEAWINWLENEEDIKQRIQRQEYIQLVKSGIGASLEEGKQKYQFENQKIDASYVYMKFSSISDSLVKVSDKDIRNHIKKNPKKYEKPQPMRSIDFVIFEIKPSAKDEEGVEETLQSLIEDKQEYSSNQALTIQGLKSTTDYEEFFYDNDSDLPFNNSYLFENELPSAIKEKVKVEPINSVLGPFKDGNGFKISKILEITKIPDSIKYSQISVPFTNSIGSESIKSKDDAKKTIDSIYKLVRYQKDKFTELAAEFNTGFAKQNSGDMGWITKNRIASPRFDQSIAEFFYENSKNSIEVIESAYSFYIIRIDEQKSFKQAYKLATFGRNIEPSEETENDIFLEAETFASNVSGNGDFATMAKEKNYKVTSAKDLKQMDEVISSLGEQREMVTWSFNDDRKVGDSNKFEVDVNGKRAYVVAQLSKISSEKDIPSKTMEEVRDLLKKEQKFTIATEKLKGNDLEEIAKNNQLTVSELSKISWENPMISGVGREPAVVAALTALPLNKLSATIKGKNGVFRAIVTNKEMPIEMNSYEGFRAGIAKKRFNRNFKINEALKEKADIEDYRTNFY